MPRKRHGIDMMWTCRGTRCHGSGVMESVMEAVCHGSVMELDVVEATVMERRHGCDVSWKRHGKVSWK